MPSHGASEIELLVVMPVYNEHASIGAVVSEWHEELSRWTQNFSLLIINDGSKDKTPEILEEMQSSGKFRLKIIHQNNCGHGQTCLRGYRLAFEWNVPFVLQLDSDGQCDPKFFGEFWKRRNDYDVIYGKRVVREDGWRRTLASVIMKIVLLARSRVICVDANVPYRLMHTAVLKTAVDKIPADFHLANVALAVLLKKEIGVRHGEVPIVFRKRFGGEPSVPLGQFGFRARQLIKQLGRLN